MGRMTCLLAKETDSDRQSTYLRYPRLCEGSRAKITDSVLTSFNSITVESRAPAVSDPLQNENDAPSDSELLDQMQHGDDYAATAIYRRYAARLLRLAEAQTGSGLSRRIDAEDVVQSVFRTFFRRAATGHYVLPDGDELWKLFLVITLNKIRKKSNFHRAAKRDVGRTQSIGSTQLSSDDEASQILKLTIDELISSLPPSHRGVIRDRIRGFEIADLAERNKLSRRTVERVLQSFRDRLRQELQEYEES